MRRTESSLDGVFEGSLQLNCQTGGQCTLRGPRLAAIYRHVTGCGYCGTLLRRIVRAQEMLKAPEVRCSCCDRRTSCYASVTSQTPAGRAARLGRAPKRD